MHTQEIPREQWAEVFNRLSRQHQGESVTVEVLGADLGDYDAAPHFPLMGIVSDPKNSDGERIEVLTGDSTDRHVGHFIAQPRKVELLQSEDGRDQALRVEAEGQPMTLIRFEGPMQ